MIKGTDKNVDYKILEDETPTPVLFKLLSINFAFAEGSADSIVIWRQRRCFNLNTKQ